MSKDKKKEVGAEAPKEVTREFDPEYVNSEEEALALLEDFPEKAKKDKPESKPDKDKPNQDKDDEDCEEPPAPEPEPEPTPEALPELEKDPRTDDITFPDGAEKATEIKDVSFLIESLPEGDERTEAINRWQYLTGEYWTEAEESL